MKYWLAFLLGRVTTTRVETIPNEPDNKRAAVKLARKRNVRRLILAKA